VFSEDFDVADSAVSGQLTWSDATVDDSGTSWSEMVGDLAVPPTGPLTAFEPAVSLLTLAPGDVLRLERNGTDLRAYQNGVLKLYVADFFTGELWMRPDAAPNAG
jgi:hypothetical protein